MHKLLFIFFLIIPFLAHTQDFNTQDFNNSANFAQAQLELENGEDAKAASILREIISSDSTYKNAYILLADIYNSHDRLDGLCELYAKASRVLGNEVPEFILLYGNTLYTLGRMDEAMVQYERILKDNVQETTEDEEYEEPLRSDKQSMANIKMAKRMYEKCRNSAEFKKKPVPFNPVNIGEMINSNFDEYLPSFSIDRSVMFITRKMPGGKDPVTGKDVNDEDF
jgi:tetratricopeptide (TPR) repeat protein